MKVRILKEVKAIKARKGDVVEVEADIGNPHACVGNVEIIEHDKVVINRLPRKSRDCRPKWIKDAEAAGADVAGVVSGGQLLKQEKYNDDIDS